MQAAPPTPPATRGEPPPARSPAAAARSCSAPSRLRGGDRADVVAVPHNRLLEPVAQRRARLEAEQLTRAGRVHAPAWLAVRHRRVPGDLALEADDLRHELREVADRDLLAGTEVDRLRAVVTLGRQDQPVDAVLDVEELARR